MKTLHSDEQELLDLARELATRVGKAIKEKALETAIGEEFSNRGKGGDLSKYGDLLAEQTVIDHLSKILRQDKFDRITLASEESGVKVLSSVKNPARNSRSIFIILDPIDGSNNMRPWRTPRVSVGLSLALGYINQLEQNPTLGAVQVGWVRDIFYDLDYYASVGSGAYFSAPDVKTPHTLHASKMENLNDAIVAISFGQGLDFDKHFGRLKTLLREKKQQRRIGSTVLDLTRVADGEYDAFISISGNVKIHDIAAAKLIIEEAGGVCDLRQIRSVGEKKYLKELIINQRDDLIKDVGFEVIAASTPQLLQQIIDNIK